jgi:hypothetical protein
MYLSEKTCGRKSFSCTIRDTVEELGKSDKTIVVGDWGMATQLMLLTKGKRNINEYIFEADQSTPKEVRDKMEMFKGECSQFIMYTPEFTRFLVGNGYIRENLRNDKNYERKVLINREGYEFIEIYQCRKEIR